MQSLAKSSERPIGRILLFIAGLIGLWLPVTLVWMLATGWRPGAEFQTHQLLGASIILYAAILSVLWFIAHRLDARSLSQYGLQRDRTNLGLLGLGIAIGATGIALLMSFEASLGWLRWDLSNTAGVGRAILEGLLVALGVGFIEELLFRGFLLHTFERAYGAIRASLITAIFFAVTHFIKAPEVIIATWPQFPGLVAMGLVLALARYKAGGRLGLSVGLHAGWVWAYYIVNTQNLVVYGQPGIAEWLTGIGRNPLAGLAGIVFLLLTGTLVARLPRPA